MMEDKQLNLNRPLLSVRRHTSTVASEKDNKKSTRSLVPSISRPPPYKSELKSGPVSNPGSVPFVWEQSPGMPKDERKQQTHIERPPVAPKLPPGRIMKVNQQDNDNASETLTVNKSQIANPRGLQCVSELDESSRRFESAEDTLEEAEVGNTDSGDDDEVYEDALETLSRTESFLNCSVTGISGLDDLNVKPSGTLSTDPHAREFMINRFLPAAKAMVSETPQYPPAPKKQPILEDNPRLLKKVVNGDEWPQLRYGPSFAQHYSEFHDNGEEESDDDCDESGNFPTKVCGLLPRFCLKSRLLNPLPGMSVRTRLPMSSATRVQARSSSSSTCSKTENGLSSFDMSEQRSVDGLQTTELHEEKNALNNKSCQISTKSQKLAPCTNRQGGMSNHYNESSQSTEQRALLPAIHVEAKDARVDGLSSHETNCRSFRDLLADPNTSEEVDSGSLAVEKTLYVDTVHKGDSPKKRGTSVKGLSNLIEKDDGIFTKIVDKKISEDSSLIEELSNVNGGDILQSDFEKPLDFSPLSLADEHSQKIEKNAPKALGEDQNLYKDAVDSKNIEVPVKQAATQSLGKQTPKAEKLENFHGIYSEFPVPPPLPKSPSDSWLCRTLPSMSSKNSSIRSQFGTRVNPRNQASKKQSGDPKWETIVKTTNVHHQHLRYSEELLVPIPES